MSASCCLVVGLGKTGHSIARYLQRRQRSFVVFDTRDDPLGLSEFQAEFPETPVFLGALPEFYFGEISEVICSPGAALDSPVLLKAKHSGIPVIGDIECFARDMRAPVIAITGTNGKSTVTTLVGEMAKADHRQVAVAGNIGLPVLDLLEDGIDYALCVLELSSFQLELVSSLRPIAATVLNITSDHLDRHHTMAAYQQAKHRVYHHAAMQLYNREDPSTRPDNGSNQAHIVSFGFDVPQPGHWGLRVHHGEKGLSCGEDYLLPVDRVRIKGRHNVQNAMAACALAQAAGISRAAMVAVLENFPGLPHRSQWVRTLEGVEWINDSKGTNVGATLSAISGVGGSMQGKIVLIAGGQGKGADFTELRAPIATFVRAVVLMGEDAAQLEATWSDLVPIHRVGSMEEAVSTAREAAHPGDVVLLSPACASLDMFRDFNHRGDSFAASVGAL